MSTSKGATRRGRPITRNREHVVDTAMNAYWQDDNAAVSVNAICALAKVSKPSLYRDFSSEDGLTTAVLDRYAQAVLEPLKVLLSSPTTFDAKLDAVIDFASHDPRMATGCLFVKMRATRSRFGPHTRSRIAAIEADMLEVYSRFFSEAIVEGNEHLEIAPDLAAAYLYEQMGLAVSQRAAGKSSASVRDLLALALSVLR